MAVKYMLFSLILFCNLTELSAQPISYRFMKLDNRQGLSNNQVTCFLKDSQGTTIFDQKKKLLSGTAEHIQAVSVYLTALYSGSSKLSSNIIQGNCSG